MIHARPDYNRFQDPAIDDPSLLGEGCSPIGEDEPVMLFRAQDKHFIGVLEDYANRINEDSSMNHVEAMRLLFLLELHMKRSDVWQMTHRTKAPDMPKEPS